jgi:hypothetical protein
MIIYMRAPKIDPEQKNEILDLIEEIKGKITDTTSDAFKGFENLKEALKDKSTAEKIKETYGATQKVIAHHMSKENARKLFDYVESLHSTTDSYKDIQMGLIFLTSIVMYIFNPIVVYALLLIVLYALTFVNDQFQFTKKLIAIAIVSLILNCIISYIFDFLIELILFIPNAILSGIKWILNQLCGLFGFSIPDIDEILFSGIIFIINCIIALGIHVLILKFDSLFDTTESDGLDIDNMF